MSLPSWERGLKYRIIFPEEVPEHVAPLVGAWIEILHLTFILSTIDVAPLVGAWIEIDNRWTNF